MEANSSSLQKILRCWQSGGFTLGEILYQIFQIITPENVKELMSIAPWEIFESVIDEVRISPSSDEEWATAEFLSPDFSYPKLEKGNPPARWTDPQMEGYRRSMKILRSQFGDYINALDIKKACFQMQPRLESELVTLIRNQQESLAVRELRESAGWLVSEAKSWVANRHFELNTIPCPYCGRPLATAQAKQCFQCGMDWHDAENVVRQEIKTPSSY